MLYPIHPTLHGQRQISDHRLYISCEIWSASFKLNKTWHMTKTDHFDKVFIFWFTPKTSPRVSKQPFGVIEMCCRIWSVPGRNVCQQISLIRSDHAAGIVSIMRFCFALQSYCFGIQHGVGCVRPLWCLAFSSMMRAGKWAICWSHDCLLTIEFFLGLWTCCKQLWLVLHNPAGGECWFLFWYVFTGCSMNIVTVELHL